MANISSATTLTLTAFLTETGRKYLFGTNNAGTSLRLNGTEDLFKPVSFSLYDSDVNYQCSELLESGDLINLSGNKGNKCLSTVFDQNRKNLLIFKEGLRPSISFEKSLYELNEGDSILIRVFLSYLSYSLEDKSVRVSKEIIGTTLSDSEFLLQNGNDNKIVFKEGVQEFTFIFDSLTTKTLPLGTTKDLKLKLSDFAGALPGQVTDTIIRVTGTNPPPIGVEFNNTLFSMISTQQVNVYNESTLYVQLDSETSVLQERVNLRIRLAGLSINDDFQILIHESQSDNQFSNPIVTFDSDVVKKAIELDIPIALSFDKGHKKIKIVIKVGGLPNISAGSIAKIGFKLENPRINTFLKEKYTSSLTINAVKMLPNCTPVYISDTTFAYGMDLWSQKRNDEVPVWNESTSPLILAVQHQEDWQIGNNSIKLSVGGGSADSYDRTKLPNSVELVNYIKQQEQKGLQVSREKSGFFTNFVFQKLQNNSVATGDYIVKFLVRNYTLINPENVLFNPTMFIIAGDSPDNLTVRGKKDIGMASLESSIVFNTYEIPIKLKDDTYIGFYLSAIDGATVKTGLSGTVPLPLILEIDSFQVICGNEGNMVEVCTQELVSPATNPEYSCTEYSPGQYERSPKTYISSTDDTYQVGLVNRTCTLNKPAQPAVYKTVCKWVPKT